MLSINLRSGRKRPTPGFSLPRKLVVSRRAGPSPESKDSPRIVPQAPGRLNWARKGSALFVSRILPAPELTGASATTWPFSLRGYGNQASRPSKISTTGVQLPVPRTRM